MRLPSFSYKFPSFLSYIMTILCQPSDVFHLSLTKNKFIMAREKQDGHASSAAKTWSISFTSEELGELGLALTARVRELEECAEIFSREPEAPSERAKALKWAQECKDLMKKINLCWSGYPG